MTVAALIVAAGRGYRAGGAVPKQYRMLAGEAVLVHAARPFLTHPRVDRVQVVIGAADEQVYAHALGRLRDALAPPVHGGETRQTSVRRGLEALAARAPRFVLIHDAARPFASGAIVDGVLDALDAHAGAIAAEPVRDTLKRASPERIITATLERAGLWAAQTPQGFHFDSMLDAHRRAEAAGLDHFTDDAALAEWAGMEVALVAGSAANLKITTADDLAMAARLLAPGPGWETRVGTGFDVHRFVAGDHVWLCGVRVPHDQTLEGHSDADAGLHALTDALLGAIGAGDIGEHFPPSDPQWKGAASHLFLSEAVRRIAVLGGRIGNVDVTLLCEAPKIAPHRTQMRETIARVLGIDSGRVSVKATTMESLGFVGRREGIAAMASCTVLLPI